MIKRSTVIKRMISKNLKPVSVGIGAIGVVVLISVMAGRYFDIDPNIIYWGIVLVFLVGAGIKWSYDWNKTSIELEQKQLLRDIERKHL